VRHTENSKPQDKKRFNIKICEFPPQVYVHVLCDIDANLNNEILSMNYFSLYRYTHPGSLE